MTILQLIKAEVGTLSTDVTVRTERRPIADDEATRPARALPPELAATILAVSAVLIGVLFDVPAYGIFLGWAAAGLAGGNRTAGIRVLGCCLVVGALFGAGTLAGQSALAQILGPGVPAWVCTVAVLAIANPLMVLLGRVPAFGSVPGMFIGFSTLLAVHLSDAAPISGSILGALLVSVAMNLTGLGFHWLNSRMTRRTRRAPGRSTGRALPMTTGSARHEPKLRP